MKTFFSQSRLLALFAKSTFVFALTIPIASHAQWVVVDPTNLIQNTITAVESVINEINQVKQLQEMVKGNLSGLNIPGFSDFVAQARQIAALVDSAQKLKSVIGDAQSSVVNIQSMYGAGSYRSFSEFAADIARRKAVGERVATNVFRAAEEADQEIVAASAAHQKIAASLAGVSGVTEATQATASAVGVLIQQNQSVLSMMSAAAKAQGAAAARKDAEEEAANKSLADYQKRGAAEYKSLMNRY